MGLKNLKETYKLRGFIDDLALILQDPLKGIEFLMKNLKDFVPLSDFNINKQKERCW